MLVPSRSAASLNKPHSRATARLWGGAALLSGLALTATYVDLPFARWLASEPLRGDIGHTIMLSEAFGYAGTVALILIVVGTLDRWSAAIRLAAISFGSGLLADIAKLLLGRTRPHTFDLATNNGTFRNFLPWLDSASDAWNHVHQSFPSAHTAVAVGLAIGFSQLYPRGWFIFACLAMITACQRMMSQSHYLSDCLAGAAIAFAASALMMRFDRAATVSECAIEGKELASN